MYVFELMNHNVHNCKTLICLSSIRFGQICAFLGFTRANARVPHGLMGFTRANARVPHGLRGVSPVGLSWQCWTILTLMNRQKQRSSPRELPKTESSDVCLCSFGKIFWRRSLMSTREFASHQNRILCSFGKIFWRRSLMSAREFISLSYIPSGKFIDDCF